jgi:hypothetical protein
VVEHDLAGVAGAGGLVELALEARAAQVALAAARRGARRVQRLGLGPRRRRAPEQPALAEVRAGLAQQRQLLLALDALGHDPGADLVGERDRGAQHRLPARVAIDAGDHPAGELEEVRADLGDVLERREAGPGVVDGDHRAAREPRAQAVDETRAVLHRVLLGQLDDQARRQPLRELQQPRVAEVVGGDVDEQQPPVGRGAGLGDRRPAGHLELLAQAGTAGRGERDVGRERDQARRRGEAREPLVADRREVGQPDDRLEDSADRARLQERAHVVGPPRGDAIGYLPHTHHTGNRPGGAEA